VNDSVVLKRPNTAELIEQKAFESLCIPLALNKGGRELFSAEVF
jgi:hypothetical protein